MNNYRKVTLDDGSRVLIYVDGQEGPFRVARLLQVLHESHALAGRFARTGGSGPQTGGARICSQATLRDPRDHPQTNPRPAAPPTLGHLPAPQPLRLDPKPTARRLPAPRPTFPGLCPPTLRGHAPPK